MSAQGASAAGGITPDELIALNEEIVSLVRAGVPLAPALAGVSKDLPGRLGRLAQAIAERLERGESFEQVLEDFGAQLPPVYRAVVSAGARSGRLAAALEAVSRYARRVYELRQLAIAGLVYPLFLIALAWVLFGVYTATTVPDMIALLGDLDGRAIPLLGRLAQWGKTAVYWAPVLPAFLVVLVTLRFLFARRVSILGPCPAGGLFGWLPWVRKAWQSFRFAMFTELLASLVDGRVPLHEALRLAADATNDGPLRRSALAYAEALEQGRPLGEVAARRMPAVFGWIALGSPTTETLVQALRRGSQLYYDRALRQAELARVCVPIITTLLVGVTVVLTYAVLVFGPWAAILTELSKV